MRSFLTLSAIAVVIAATGLTPSTPVTAAAQSSGAALQSIGPLAFGPNDVLFAADTVGASIYALELGDAAKTPAQGTKDVPDLDQKIAALLGTDVSAIAVTDLAIHPTTKNAFIAVTRGQGADAKPALVRVDGNGKLEVLALDAMKHTRAALPNAPVANTTGRRNPRADSITDMSFVDGKLIVAGLSNEEFASKLRTIAYPFAAVEPGTSVEIYHGNHGRSRRAARFTRSSLHGEQHAAPDRRLSVHAAGQVPGGEPAGTQKVVGTTIAELGAGNRPIDMFVYKKDGKRVPADVEHQPRRHEDSDR